MSDSSRDTAAELTTTSRSEHPERVAERLLLLFCRDPEAAEYEGGTARATEENALAFLEKTVPGVEQAIRGRDVLDFGCGTGLQALAMARSGARRVVGFDLPRDMLLDRWRAIEALGVENLQLTTSLPASAQFDVVVSCSSFEHFAEPEAILGEMAKRTRSGGRLIISFAEPWWSPYGSHMDGFTRLPWVNVFFSERTVMSVRSRYRSDGAARYEEVEGGLNRMTVRRFEHIIARSGLEVEHLRLFSVKGLPIVTRMPLLRELLTSAVSATLVKR